MIARQTTEAMPIRSSVARGSQKQIWDRYRVGAPDLTAMRRFRPKPVGTIADCASGSPWTVYWGVKIQGLRGSIQCRIVLDLCWNRIHNAVEPFPGQVWFRRLSTDTRNSRGSSYRDHRARWLRSLSRVLPVQSRIPLLAHCALAKRWLRPLLPVHFPSRESQMYDKLRLHCTRAR